MTHYLALGDSISIDDYTGVAGGGAASQFARLLKANPFQNLTADGHTTAHVMETVPQIVGRPDVITLTVGGNDLLALAITDQLPSSGTAWSEAAMVILDRVCDIADGLHGLGSQLILNTIYDPTDGSDEHLLELGLPLAARNGLAAYNLGVRALARRRGYALADLEDLFQGHGFWSADSWLTEVIEPNLKGATAISSNWFRLAV